MSADLKTIGEAADVTGVTEDTLRFYEKIGVLLEVERNESGHRRYSDRALAWIALVVRLRSTGMTLESIQAYAELARRGSETIPQRREILIEHRDQIAAEARRLSEIVALIDRKVAGYDEILRSGIIPQVSPCEVAPPA